MTALMLVVGLVVLTAGAELLVRGASWLAGAARISPLIIGLTVVAFGTSAPELVVSVQSTLSGQPEIALGNVVGSNIFNVLFILGLAAVITPLAVDRQLIRTDVPIMIGMSALALALAADRIFGRVDGLILLALLLAYTAWLIRTSRREPVSPSDEFAIEFPNPHKTGALTVTRHVLTTAIGLVLLVVGARWFCDAAVVLATAAGVSELVIGLTIVAAGTSLPEAATSVVAAFRGERDIAVGNIVGSNLFNIMGVLGCSALSAPHGIPVSDTAFQQDLPVMTAVAAICLPIFISGFVVSRWEGALFFASYVTYTTYLVSAATDHPGIQQAARIMLAVLIPLTVLAIAVSTIQTWRQRRASHIN